MATQSTYYLNGPSLSSATAVFTDANLTTCAPDGYYRQGSVVRQLVGCVLLPPQVCPACVDNCNTGTIESSTAESVFNVSLFVGDGPADVGAIIIRFNPLTVPDGIYAQFDSVIYNTLSSPTYGLLSAVSNLPIYIGDSGSDCGLVIDSPHVLDVYSWYNAAFNPTLTTETVTILPTQLDLTVTSPGQCVMVVPKPLQNPSIIDIKIISPCPLTDFAMDVSCPTILPEFASSQMFESSVEACSGDRGETYYYVHVNGAAGVLGLYDWVFSDYYGQTVLSNGYYSSTSCPPGSDWFRVQDGIIVEFGAC